MVKNREFDLFSAKVRAAIISPARRISMMQIFLTLDLFVVSVSTSEGGFSSQSRFNVLSPPINHLCDRGEH